MTIKPKLTSKKYKDHKLNMTQHGYNTDFFDAMARFYTEEERESGHRVIANAEGRCTDVIHGRVLDFGPLSGQWEEGKQGTNSKFVWVMDDSGNLYVDLHRRIDGIFHSAMMGGYRPIGAGEICISDGFIVMLNEDSGHYAPCGTLAMVVAELKDQGFKFPDVTLRDSQHSAIQPRIAKQDVRGRLITTNQLAAGLKQEGVKV